MKIHEDNLVWKEIHRLKSYLVVDRHFEENILDDNSYVNQLYSSLEKQISISILCRESLAHHFDDSLFFFSSVLFRILSRNYSTNKSKSFHTNLQYIRIPLEHTTQLDSNNLVRLMDVQQHEQYNSWLLNR